MDEEIINRKVDRRRLLGRAGAVAATVAGAGAVSAAVGSPASAAPGDEVVLGQLNDAGTTATELKNNSTTNPSLRLTNSSLSSVGGVTQAGPALELKPGGDYTGGPKGSLGVSTDGVLWLVDDQGPVFVRTAFNTTVVESFNPVRILDTRPEEGSTGKASMLNPSVLNSSGYIPAGRTLNVRLDSLFRYVETIYANITVLAGGGAGFLTVFPGGRSRPLASNVNYTPGAIVANFAMVSVGSLSGANFAISIYAHTAAKVILDISGAVVNLHDDIIWSSVPGGDPRPLRSTIAAEQRSGRQRPEVPPQP